MKLAGPRSLLILLACGAVFSLLGCQPQAQPQDAESKEPPPTSEKPPTSVTAVYLASPSGGMTDDDFDVEYAKSLVSVRPPHLHSARVPC
jgi:hypothetical protein